MDDGESTSAEHSTTDATASDASSGNDGPLTSDAASTSGGSTHGSDSGETGGDDGTTEPVDPKWQDFLDARNDLLEELAVPIVDCVANHDTDHPAFFGCIDWHSAVHATYALHVVFRFTGTASYLDAAQAHLTPAQLDAELDRVQDGDLPQEIPYGYAWFLALAIERERATGSTDLQALATEIAHQLGQWLADRSTAQIRAGVLDDDYDNLSWAALNLWRWAKWSEDPALEDEMVAFATDVLLDPAYDETCPLALDTTEFDDFFPPCLHRAMAITLMAPESAVQAWIEASVPATYSLTPLGPADIDSAHQSGLNFSRAWGLWHLWVATGDTQFRDLYREHVLAHVAQPEFWAEDYAAFSHWVAQFGVHAIALSEP